MHKIIRRLLGQAVDTADENAQALEDSVESVVDPVRKSFYRRYPVVFTLLASFGAVITFLGFEQLVLQTNFFRQNPLLMVALGITILVFTGKLSKKLE